MIAESGARGRSSVIRASRRLEGRRRPYAARWVGSVLVLGTMAGLVVVVALRALPAEGLGALLYTAHDRGFLPLKGWLWTAVLPYGLSWMVLLALALGTLALEALTALGPLRRMHGWVLRRVLFGGLGAAALRSTALRLQRGRVRLGFARAVVDTQFAIVRRAWVVGGAAPSSRRTARLLNLADLRWLLGSRDELERLKGFEALAFARASGNADRVASAMHRLRDDLRVGAPAWWCDALDELESGRVGHSRALLEMVDALREGIEPTHGPVALAAAVILTAVEVVRDGTAETTLALVAWSRVRLEAPGASPRLLRTAEAAIAFEYWTSLAESSVLEQPLGPLLRTAFADAPTRAALGEIFAWEGSTP